MRIEELHSYWEAARSELIETLEGLDESIWDERMPSTDSLTIRQVSFRVLDAERFWILQVAQGKPWIRASRKEYPDNRSIIEAIEAEHAATRRYMSTFEGATLRAVRTVPSDAMNNQIEENVSLAWIFWRVMELSIFYRGQLELAREVLKRESY